MNTLAFVIGLATVAVFLLSYLQKKRKHIIALNVLSRGLYILQYILLSAFEGAVLDVTGILASVLAQKKEFPFIKKAPEGLFPRCQRGHHRRRSAGVSEFVQPAAHRRRAAAHQRLLAGR